MVFQSTDISVHTIAQPRFQGWQRPPSSSSSGRIIHVSEIKEPPSAWTICELGIIMSNHMPSPFYYEFV